MPEWITTGALTFRAGDGEPNAPIELAAGERRTMRSVNDVAAALEPGESNTMMFQVPTTWRGEREIGCVMPGHVEGGQQAPLIIT